MNDSMIGNSNGYFNNSNDEDITVNQSNLPDVENKARLLMQDILVVCQNINLLNVPFFTSDHDSQLQANELKGRLLRLCRVLITVKEKLIQYTQAMERNVQVLENQNLNTIEADIEIIRSVELASFEVKRLKLLLDEIEKVLTQSEEIIPGHVAQSFDPPSQHIPAHLNEKHEQTYDLDHILADYEKTPCAIPEYRTAHNPTCPETDIGPPRLQDTPPSSLNNTLRKIPTPSTDQVIIHADLYDGGLFVQNTYLGRTNLNYGPYDHVAGQMALGVRHGNPILAEVGFDGRYNARTHEGMMTPFPLDQFGDSEDK